MTASYVPSLRAVLIVLLAGSVLSQVLLPVLAEDLGGPYEETAHLVVPYSVVGILVIGCAQGALVATWRLLSLITTSIFTVRALRWVDAIIACGATAALLSAAVAVHLLVIVGVGGPGVLFFLAASVTGGTAFVLFMAGMRDRLRAAITHQGEPGCPRGRADQG